MAKYSPRAKSGPLTVFVNKVLLEQSHAHSFMHCLWLLSCYNGRVEKLQQRVSKPKSLKYITIFLTEKVCRSLVWGLDPKVMLLKPPLASDWFRTGPRLHSTCSIEGWCGWDVGSLLEFSRRGFNIEMCRKMLCPFLLAFVCCHIRTSYLDCGSLLHPSVMGGKGKSITEKANKKSVISSYSFCKPWSQLPLVLVFETISPCCSRRVDSHLLAGSARQVLSVLLAPKSLGSVWGTKEVNPTATV